MSKKKSPFYLNPWFAVMVIFGFTATISFFQINSYWADQHKFNGIFGWLGIGIVTGIIAVFSLIRLVKSSTGQEG